MPRLFVGNLGDQVDRNALESQFSKFGPITNIDLKEKTDPDGNVMMRFAFVNIDAQSSALHECVRQVNSSSCLGPQVRVEVAKESFMERLKRERMEAQKGESFTPPPAQDWDRFNRTRKEQDSYSQRPYNEPERPWQKRGAPAEESMWQKRGAPAEESMMSSFKNYSSFWDDNDREDQSYDYNRKPRNNMDYNNTYEGDSYDAHEDGEEKIVVGDVRKEHEEQFKVLRNIRDSRGSEPYARSTRTYKGSSSIKPIMRYDPTKDESQKKGMSDKDKQAPEDKIELADKSKFIKISDRLEFGNAPLSFLATFNEKKQEETVEEEVKYVPKKSREVYVRKPKGAIRKKHGRNHKFFLTSKDKAITGALEWLPKTVTDAVSRQFHELQGELRDLIKRRYRPFQSKPDAGSFPAHSQAKKGMVTLEKDTRWRALEYRT